MQSRQHADVIISPVQLRVRVKCDKTLQRVDQNDIMVMSLGREYPRSALDTTPGGGGTEVADGSMISPSTSCRRHR